MPPPPSSAPQAADTGRAYRQLAALDLSGNGAAFTGTANTCEMGSHAFANGIAAGNMLTGTGVLAALSDTYLATTGPIALRLLAALRAAEAAGGDSRGLFSAALLILHPDHPPLSLRVDYHEHDPITALTTLHEHATTGDYAAWTRQVPVANDKTRVLD